MWVLAALGCGQSSDDQAGTGSVACDPLAAEEEPITLGQIIAVGKDANGHYYLADTDPNEPSRDRIFVSESDTLGRKRVDGSGSSGGTSVPADFTWTFENDGSSERLVVHKDGARVTGIALAPAGERTFYADLDSRAEQLTPADPGEVAGLKVVNLPGETILQYVANVEDGSQVVVTRPVDDFSYERYRVFAGSGGDLIERSCSYTGPRSYIAFDCLIDGASWHITFASQLAPTVRSELRKSETTALSLTLVDPPALDPDYHFICLDR